MHDLQKRLKLSAFAKSLVDQHGWPLDEACDVAGLPVAEFIASAEAVPIANYMPRPCEIQQRAKDIRSGEIVLNKQSGKNWEQYRGEQKLLSMTEEQQRDAFDLAGTIDEDAAMVPGWFRG
jgi:hypothetical protein